MSTYSINKVKLLKTRDGLAFQCDLLRAGKKVASCSADGLGIKIKYVWTNQTEVDILATHAKKLNVPTDIVILKLIDSYDEDRQLQKLKQQCKKLTLVHVKGTPKGEFATFHAEYTPANKKRIVDHLKQSNREVDYYLNDKC